LLLENAYLFIATLGFQLIFSVLFGLFVLLSQSFDVILHVFNHFLAVLYFRMSSCYFLLLLLNQLIILLYPFGDIPILGIGISNRDGIMFLVGYRVCNFQEWQIIFVICDGVVIYNREEQSLPILHELSALESIAM